MLRLELNLAGLEAVWFSHKLENGTPLLVTRPTVTRSVSITELDCLMCEWMTGSKLLPDSDAATYLYWKLIKLKYLNVIELKYFV